MVPPPTGRSRAAHYMYMHMYMQGGGAAQRASRARTSC